MSNITTAKKLSKLTPLEQELELFKGISKRTLSFWSFRKIHTWKDYERYLGTTRLVQLDEEMTDKVGETPPTLVLIKADLELQEQHIKDKYDRLGNLKQASDNGLKHDQSKDTVPSLVDDNQKTLWTPAKQHPLQTCRLIKQQEEAAKEALDALFLQDHDAHLLRAGVGTGKTFVAGMLLRRIADLNLLQRYAPQCIAPWPIVYITKASIVEQTKRALHKHFGLNVVNQVVVTHYDALRATFGEMFIKWKTEIVHGEPVVNPEWKPRLHPVFFIWDECQALKNEDSLQSRVGQALNDIAYNYSEQVGYTIRIKQLFMSATPFTRVCEAKCFAVATRAPYKYGINPNATLSNSNWSDFASHIAAPSEPEEHNEAAIGRLVEYLLDYFGSIKNLRPQFHARNGIKVISFSRPELRQRYDKAWENYQRRKAEIEGRDSDVGSSRMALLAAFTIWRREAELIKAEDYLAADMYHQYKEGFAPVAACCFKGTITKTVRLLIEQYGIDRNDISIIWGGMEKVKKVQKKRADIMSDETRAMLEDKFGEMDEGSIDIFKSLLDSDVTIEEKVNEDVPKHYRLGTQSYKERQLEIDRFQSGQSKFCFFTFKAGGVGLSLHHCDELTKEKVRLKDNGYSYEEDIISIPIRPRVVTLTPTYSAPELVQGLGRCPRLTSLSDTNQLVVFYGGTIEEQVARSVSTKLKCLKKVVRMKESWEDIIVKGSGAAQSTTQEQLTPDILELNKPVIIQSDNPDEDSFIGSEEGDSEDE